MSLGRTHPHGDPRESESRASRNSDTRETRANRHPASRKDLDTLVSPLPSELRINKPISQPGRGLAPADDVLVVGAGFVGSIVALLLQREGHRVRLFDPRPTYPDWFRAEKLEPDQTQALRELGLFDTALPRPDPIEEVVTHRGGDVERNAYDGQFGMRYPDVVNRLRDRARQATTFEARRIVRIDHDAQRHVIATCADGATFAARLCVIASGGRQLLERLNVPTTSRPGIHSLSIGFDVEPVGRSAPQIPAFNCHSPAPRATGIHYATFFPIEDCHRLNLFTGWRPQDERVSRFRSNPVDTLLDAFPTLQGHYGAFRVTTSVAVAPTTYHRVTAATDGIVALGDAYQAISPATGLGLSKCLSDCRVFQRHATRWLRNAAVTADDVRGLYTDPEKVRMDNQARDAWVWFHEQVHGRSLLWRLQRRLPQRVRTMSGDRA